MINSITDKKAISTYQPSNEVALFTAKVKKDYAIGEDILTTSYLELNDRSIIDDENRGQIMFNAFVDTSVEDPSEAWKWRGTRSKARNKGIAMHANLTGNFLLPIFIAQNEDDEIDRDFSEVMRDIIEWMASPTNSNYQSSFIQIVFGMLINPVTYLGAVFYECYQMIKEKQADGSYTKKEILDEVLSGFKAPIYSSSQILITNAFERNIQRQRAIIKRRYCEKEELEAKHKKHTNWEYVQEGIKSIYNDEDGLFYDVKDTEHPNLVIEETYLNRRDDTEVCFCNGIYMGDTNVENNPIKHRDNKGAPKYNVIPFGYSRIGEHFFYYKSMMNALGWDNMLYDAMSEIIMNRALLEVDMPIAISGADKIDSDVIFPNSVVSFKDKDVKISPLMPSSNLNAGFSALKETEDSITDGSVNETMSGQLPDKEQKAYSVANAQANAKKMIGAVGKSLAESIIQYGDLMKDIALNHITTPELDELVGGGMKLKYRTFLLENKTSVGKKVDKKIKFDESLIGMEMTDEEKMSKSMKLLEESGYPEEKVTIRLVNPELFAKFKYLTKCDVEEMFSKNAEYWQPVLSNLTQMLAQNPYVDQEWLTRKLMYAFFQSEGDDGVKKQSMMPQLPQQNGTPLNAMVRGKQEGKVAAGVV